MSRILQAHPDVIELTGQVTVSQFANHTMQRHGNESNEWQQVRLVLKANRETYGQPRATEFDPVRLENYRQTLIDRGLTRQVITRKENLGAIMYLSFVA